MAVAIDPKSCPGGWPDSADCEMGDFAITTASITITTAYNCMYLRPTHASHTKNLQPPTQKYRNLMHAKQFNRAKSPTPGNSPTREPWANSLKNAIKFESNAKSYAINTARLDRPP
jgi:hypothetical protein